MVDLSWAMALLPLAGAGFGVGFLVGLTGVGGGALMTPLLISTFGVRPAVAVGTDLLYASVTKTVGGWRHHVAENVDWPIVLRLAAGSIPAALLVLAVMAFIPFDTAVMAAMDSLRPRLRAAGQRHRHRALSHLDEGTHRRQRDRHGAAAHRSHGAVRRGAWPARDSDIGRRRRHRRGGAGLPVSRRCRPSASSAPTSPMRYR